MRTAVEIFCGPTEILLSQTQSVLGKRLYDANGDLTQRHFREPKGRNVHEL